MAGPIRCSSARSGPIANGISATTIRKNNTPISAPPPTRTAMRMSRRKRADKRAHAGPEPQFAQVCETERRMRRRDDHSAGGEMRCASDRAARPAPRHRARRSARRAARAGARWRPGAPATTAAAGRRKDRRPASRAERLQADRAKRACARRRRRRDSSIQNDRFSQHRKRRLQRVLVAEIMRLLGDAALGLAALELHVARPRPQQARDHPQQRRFAGPVATGHRQRLTGREREIQRRQRPRGRPGSTPGLRPKAACRQSLAWNSRRAG